MELRTAQQRLKQLNATIRLKEAFIRELVRSGGEAEVTKRKCEAKMSRLEREVQRARQLHQETQHQLKELREGESPGATQFQSRVDSLKKQISHYQKKLSTLGKVADISQHGDTKVTELEGSVKEMRRQQGELQTRLTEETQRKEELEQQITVDQRLIRELEIRLKQGEGEVEGERGWLMDEEERILSLREATEQLQVEVERREEAVRHRERMQKEKTRLETCRGERGDCETDAVSEDKEGEGEQGGERRESDIREEISHLRDARDSLMVHRQTLDKRIHKSGGRREGSGEERRLVELDEAIEAVDAAIEYKNEVICGRAKELRSHALLLNQDHLMERLVSLSHEETRSLLVKYFGKVIDLRVEFRKQDIAFSDIESQYEEQSRYISDLKAAYQQASLEMERRITLQQRDYQQKISTLLRQFND
ncbi:Kinesin-like protein KIF7 [Chionoecetes opilio]|uniref:Kinesin-like protein KIF7 n=1 Tax=Chionoecetes opilio TaxID=41210 RepID=A0A8J5CJ36_CHIOP|nr:Kinesin-like protein KIF7 [Chionoecetes opilio]